MMKYNRLMRTLVALILSLVLCMSTCLPTLAQTTMYEELLTLLAENANEGLLTAEAQLTMYKNAIWDGLFNAMPESFDLRDTGVVPEVRSQGNWGTCWGFAAISASEMSILSELNMTTEEFLAATGQEMDLSEKHLSWFGTNHLPTLSETYPYEGLESQAGEGIHHRDSETLGDSVYYNGGLMSYASSIFSAGMGPVTEADVPYLAADGTSSTASDWSLDESMRFGTVMQLENSSILPIPVGLDADGNYVYNAAATEAIKNEVLNGRGVSIAYYADMAIDPQATVNMVKDQIIALGIDCTDEQVQLYQALRNGEYTVDEVSEENQRFFMTVMLAKVGIDVSEMSIEEIYQAYDELLQALAEAEAEAEEEVEDELLDEQSLRKMAEEMGLDYDQYLETTELVAQVASQTYINTDTYAQYTDSVYASPTHGVTIIGWDDNYSASNFLADRQPPADGAWIVRNSWGSDYGNDGYFYLSYYDQSIYMAESFDFLLTDDPQTAQVDIMGYDFMQADSICSVRMDESCAIANIFTMESDNVLSDISIMTADLNTEVTAAVYLLNENATSPTDGTMLEILTETFMYGGYHRISLNYHYAVPEGARISIVQEQSSETTEGTVFNIPYTSGASEAYMELLNAFEEDLLTQWVEGKIGEGESFVCVDGEWFDWADLIAELQSSYNLTSLLSYDNLNMKLYAYTLEEVESLHTFQDPCSFHGVTIQICTQCGYTIIEQ